MDTYRLILTFDYANGPLRVESQPTDLDDALAKFAAHISDGGFTPHAHRHAAVMSDYEWQKVRTR